MSIIRKRIKIGPSLYIVVRTRYKECDLYGRKMRIAVHFSDQRPTSNVGGYEWVVGVDSLEWTRTVVIVC